METVTVEYIGGPADGRREQAHIDESRQPSRLRILSVEYRPLSEQHPAPPGEEHRYLLQAEQPSAGDVWRYSWGGPLR